MPYAIKCMTEGEQRLAQEIMFKKGIGWCFGGTKMFKHFHPEGVWYIIRKREGVRKISFLHPRQMEHGVEEGEFQEITMSELLHV